MTPGCRVCVCVCVCVLFILIFISLRLLPLILHVYPSVHSLRALHTFMSWIITVIVIFICFRFPITVTFVGSVGCFFFSRGWDGRWMGVKPKDRKKKNQVVDVSSVCWICCVSGLNIVVIVVVVWMSLYVPCNMIDIIICCVFCFPPDYRVCGARRGHMALGHGLWCPQCDAHSW